MEYSNIYEPSLSNNVYVLNPDADRLDIYHETTLKLEHAKSMISAVISGSNNLKGLDKEAYFILLESMLADSRSLVMLLYKKMEDIINSLKEKNI